jgi:hypothetical protein
LSETEFMFQPSIVLCALIFTKTLSAKRQKIDSGEKFCKKTVIPSPLPM